MTKRQQKRELIKHLVAYAGMFASRMETVQPVDSATRNMDIYRAKDIRRIIRRLEDLDR